MLRTPSLTGLGKKSIFLIGYYLQCTKMKFSIKDFFSKCDEIHRKLVTFTEKISFFVQCQWNESEPQLENSDSCSSFKNGILNFIRPSPNNVYNC